MGSSLGGIGMKVSRGEAASEPAQSTAEWRGKELQEIFKDYSEENIFNAMQMKQGSVTNVSRTKPWP